MPRSWVRRAAARRRPRCASSSSSCSSGIPAILVDRKGDLCSYARPDMGLRKGSTGELADRAPTSCVPRWTSPCSRRDGPTAGRSRSRPFPPAWGPCRRTSASRPPSSPPRPSPDMMNYGDRQARSVLPGDPAQGDRAAQPRDIPQAAVADQGPDRLHRREGPRVDQRGRPSRRQALRPPGSGPGDPAAQPGRPAGRRGRAARRRGPPGPGCAPDAGQDPAEHHQHQVPGDQPGRPVLGLRSS